MDIKTRVGAHAICGEHEATENTFLSDAALRFGHCVEKSGLGAVGKGPRQPGAARTHRGWDPKLSLKRCLERWGFFPIVLNDPNVLEGGSIIAFLG